MKTYTVYDICTDSVRTNEVPYLPDRYKEGENPDPKRWKANFRCALKSLDDVLEVGTNGRSKGNDAYRMFQFLEEKKKPMKSSSK